MESLLSCDFLFLVLKKHSSSNFASSLPVHFNPSPAQVWTLCLSVTFLVFSMAKHKSPAKTLRSMKRLIQFLKSKVVITPLLKQNLSICDQTTIAIPPTQQPTLSVIKLPEMNIRPQKIYHPCIINACDTLFKKHPDNLSKEEIEKFNHYRKWKSEMKDPIESIPIYLPIGGLRKCLICTNLT